MLTFAYLHRGVEHHRGQFDSGLSPQRFAEELSRLGVQGPGGQPVDEIWVWDGTSVDRQPDAMVLREVSSC